MTILIHLMGYDVVAPFTFSMAAAMNTAIVFLVIFLVTSFQGYRLIYQFKLIDLFHASKKGEVAPKPSMIVAVLECYLLSWAIGLQCRTCSLLRYGQKSDFS